MSEIASQPKLVRDLMTVGVVTCSPSTPLREIARSMAEKGLEAVVVLDPEERHAIGWINQTDLVQAFSNRDMDAATAEEIMRDEVPQVPADIPLAAAAQIMLDQNVRVLYVMHHAGGIIYPAGAISFQHLMRYLSASESEELKDLGIRAERKSPIETFIERRDAAREKNLGKNE